MSSHSIEDSIGEKTFQVEENEIEMVPIMNPENHNNKNKNEVLGEEAGGAHPDVDVAIENSPDIPSTLALHKQEPVTTGVSNNQSDVSVNKTSDSPVEVKSSFASREELSSPLEISTPIKNLDFDHVMDVSNPSESEIRYPESENTKIDVSINVSESINKSPSEMNSSEISCSTPSKAIDNSSFEIKISDEDDDIVEVAIETKQSFKGSHRGTVVPYSDSDNSDSSSSSDSESSSDSSSSDSEDDVEGSITKVTPKSVPKPIKVRGELEIEDLPPIQDLHISVRNDQAVEIGKVLHTVDTLVVVECYKEQPPLDIDSVLFLDRGARPLGRIFDVMGPVTEPLYCVRFNSKEHIEEHNVQPGMLVYSAPQTEHSQFVFLKHLMMMKGSDASWKKDKEVPGSELDFSDDEIEAEVKKVSNHRTENSPRSWNEPMRKVSRLQNESGGKSGFQGRPGGHTRDNYRPRNPWGWSGARFNVPNNNQLPPSNHQNQLRYANNTQIGQESASRMYSVPPPSACNTYGQTSEYSSYTNQENGYAQGNSYAPENYYAPSNEYSHGNNYASGNNYSHNEVYPPHNTPDQRYQAFQSEIAKLVDAYNRGVDSPMTVGSATYGMRPPCPPPSSPIFGGRPPCPRPQFGLRPHGTTSQFGLGPHRTPSQFGGRHPGPLPQFGLRPPGPPPLLGSRPPGPPPQFGSRPPGPPHDNHFY